MSARASTPVRAPASTVPTGPSIAIVPASGDRGRQLIARVIARCGPASMAARFSLPAGRVVDCALRELLYTPVAYLALDGGRPVGLLNLVRSADGRVEVALLVADRWQRRGIGRALMAHAVTHSPWPGAVVDVNIQADNAGALRMLRGLDVPRRLVDMAAGELHFELLPPVGTHRLAG